MHFRQPCGADRRTAPCRQAEATPRSLPLDTGPCPPTAPSAHLVQSEDAVGHQRAQLGRVVLRPQEHVLHEEPHREDARPRAPVRSGRSALPKEPDARRGTGWGWPRTGCGGGRLGEVGERGTRQEGGRPGAGVGGGGRAGGGRPECAPCCGPTFTLLVSPWVPWGHTSRGTCWANLCLVSPAAPTPVSPAQDCAPHPVVLRGVLSGCPRPQRSCRPPSPCPCVPSSLGFPTQRAARRGGGKGSPHAGFLVLLPPNPLT